MNKALFIRNATACENAKHPKCTCVCGGALHGQSHAAKIEELWSAYRERQSKVEEFEEVKRKREAK